MASSVFAGHSSVLILDYGSQYTQLIARRIRDYGVLSILLPGDVTMVRSVAWHAPCMLPSMNAGRGVGVDGERTRAVRSDRVTTPGCCSGLRRSASPPTSSDQLLTSPARFLHRSRASRRSLLPRYVLDSWSTTTPRSFSHSLIRSFAHSLIRSFAHSLILSFAHSLIRSLPYSLARRSFFLVARTLSMWRVRRAFRTISLTTARRTTSLSSGSAMECNSSCTHWAGR